MTDWLPNYDYWKITEPEDQGDPYDEAVAREDALLDRADL